MKKIPTMFQRGPDHLVTPDVTPGCEWVLAGEGVATRKWDGTCCMVRDGRLYKRLELRLGKMAPAGFELVHHDPNTGKSFGWMPVGDGPEDRWHNEAFEEESGLSDGTYELVGPKIQSNPEGENYHILIHHGVVGLDNVPRDFDGLRHYLEAHDIEGIVFHHPDGHMAKIKGTDFGFKRKRV